MKRIVIAEGNYCKASYSVTSGTAEYNLSVWNGAEDNYQIVYEDGLYKLLKNGNLTMAATAVIIKVNEWPT